MGKDKVLDQQEKIVCGYYKKTEHTIKECRFANCMYFSYGLSEHMVRDCSQEKLLVTILPS